MAHLQGRAHDDEQVGLGEVFGVEEVLLREVLPEENHVRFDRGGAERAHGNLVVHDGVLRGEMLPRHGQEERGSASASASKVKTYLGLVGRVGGVAEVTGSCGEAAVSLHQLVLREAAHCGG